MACHVEIFPWGYIGIFFATSAYGMDLEYICIVRYYLPSGKLTVCYGKSSFLMGNTTISMASFNSFLYVYQRVPTILSKDV